MPSHGRTPRHWPGVRGLAVGASGEATCRTVVLLTPEEIDAAAKAQVNYRLPGS